MPMALFLAFARRMMFRPDPPNCPCSGWTRSGGTWKRCSKSFFRTSMPPKIALRHPPQCGLSSIQDHICPSWIPKWNSGIMEKETQPRRRVTAETMAAKQRDISVSEFFAKNRHLLGFDNPRKALLTAVKEAVDNSLDACEEAGIVPEIWVHIEPTTANRFKVGVQDNGPGIVKKQVPLIFGKLLYGSKFHRLRMSRGQQGIGISAAGMYGMLTTGKPVKIISMISAKKPAHYFEIQIDTKHNQPEIINGKGDGEDIPSGEAGQKYITDQGIEWVSQYPNPDQQSPQKHEVRSGTRVTIEL